MRLQRRARRAFGGQVLPALTLQQMTPLGAEVLQHLGEVMEWAVETGAYLDKHEGAKHTKAWPAMLTQARPFQAPPS